MKVVTSKQMGFIESQAYEHGFSDEEFMNRAGQGIAYITHEYLAVHDELDTIVLLCGKGNNAGDAYVAGTHLLELGYEVHAIQIFSIESCSPLCKQNQKKFVEAGGVYLEIFSASEISFPRRGVILDGIFGTGFRGKVEESVASIIQAANHSKLPIIAIDIPSGLNGDTGMAQGAVIQATQTAFLGLPKLGFFLQDGWNYVGKLKYVNFGLPYDYVEAVESDFIMLTPEWMKSLLPTIHRKQQKYERGYVIGLAGSTGMAGAAMLSSWAALAGGAGIVKLMHPEGMQNELVTSPYELIKIAYNPQQPEELVHLLNNATANFVGPGIGRKEEIKSLLREILPKLTKPCVIDADALTILSETEITLPKSSVLTPHKGELEKLLRLPPHQPLDLDFLKKCQKFATEKHVILLLKGGPTFIFQPFGPVAINPRGDPGMATAGSGDVLTGLIAALLSQKLSPYQAAILGVYLHAVSGEHAAFDKTSYCMTAIDIIDFLPDAFAFRSIP